MKPHQPSLKVFFEIQNLLEKAENNGFAANENELTALYDHVAKNMEMDSACFLGTLMLNTFIKSRSGKLTCENIYLTQYDVPQIRLFDILIDKLPYVKYSQQMVNRQIASLFANVEEGALLDIGIGLGTQVCNVLELLKDNASLKKLVITGIEPGSEALLKAEKQVMEMQPQLPFRIEFRGIPGFAENMDLSAIDYGAENLIVNASLALHHIQKSESRNRLLSQVKLLNPMAFFLVEPNVNHFEPDFMKRFRNSFNHFYNLFKTIDGLEIEPNEKSALKLFFGREIEDILGKTETDRFEKHEPASNWIERLASTGYTLSSEQLSIPVQSEAGVNIRYSDPGFVGFSFENETILSVIYAS